MSEKYKYMFVLFLFICFYILIKSLTHGFSLDSALTVSLNYFCLPLNGRLSINPSAYEFHSEARISPAETF